MSEQPGRYMTKCDACGQDVWVDWGNKFVAHGLPAEPNSALADTEFSMVRNLCSNSGLIDLNAEADFGVWEVNGGLPTLGKGHR